MSKKIFLISMLTVAGVLRAAAAEERELADKITAATPAIRELFRTHLENFRQCDEMLGSDKYKDCYMATALERVVGPDGLVTYTNHVAAGLPEPMAKLRPVSVTVSPEREASDLIATISTKPVKYVNKLACIRHRIKATIEHGVFRSNPGLDMLHYSVDAQTFGCGSEWVERMMRRDYEREKEDERLYARIAPLSAVERAVAIDMAAIAEIHQERRKTDGR